MENPRYGPGYSHNLFTEGNNYNGVHNFFGVFRTVLANQSIDLLLFWQYEVAENTSGAFFFLLVTGG